MEQSWISKIDDHIWEHEGIGCVGASPETISLNLGFPVEFVKQELDKLQKYGIIEVVDGFYQHVKSILPDELGLQYTTDEHLDMSVVRVVIALNKLPFFKTNGSSGANGIDGRSVITGIATDDRLMEEFVYYMEKHMYSVCQMNNIARAWWSKLYESFNGIHNELEHSSIDGLYYSWELRFTPWTYEEWHNFNIAVEETVDSFLKDFVPEDTNKTRTLLIDKLNRLSDEGRISPYQKKYTLELYDRHEENEVIRVLNVLSENPVNPIYKKIDKNE